MNISVPQELLVAHLIRCDAKGQRQKLQQQNGTTTTYEHDTYTFRVKRIRTTRSSDSAVLQALQYWYDPVGNITLQKDLAHQPVYFNGSVADAQNNYVYDALYRLIQAQGRELAGDNSAPSYNDSSRSGITPVPIASTDTAKMRRYTQYYDYDAVGNFVQMRHTVTGGTGNWTRYYTTNAANNRLQQTVVGSGTPENYGYDTRGNITGGFSHLQSLTYNADNRLEKIVIDSNRTAYYQYDSSGQRVRKTVVNTSANTTDSRKYVGEWELYHKFTTSSLTTIVKRETLHVSDDTGRIALIDTRTSGTGTEPVQLLRYQYSNHLQSASLELDASGAVISYEEYYPYGSTSFQSGRSSVEVSLKRYRYTGKERDEESGLYYHGARYYIPWLCRWLSSDPINNENYNLQRGYGFGKNKRRQFLELAASPYEYCYDNPVRFTDPKGEQVPPTQTAPKSIPVPWELTRNLPKGGELPKGDLAKQLRELIKNLPKLTPEPAAPVGPKSPVPPRPNPIILFIYAMTLSTPAHAPTSQAPAFSKSPVETAAPFKEMKSKEEYMDEQREKEGNTIYRTMQTINGEWIKSPLTGADNARQLGARNPKDITPLDGMVGPILDENGRFKGLSASSSLTEMELKLFNTGKDAEYKNKEGAVGMFDIRLLPEGLGAKKDDGNHVTIYPKSAMTMEEYTAKLNSIQWVPVSTKSK